jgi:hypothetical protein
MPEEGRRAAGLAAISVLHYNKYLLFGSITSIMWEVLNLFGLENNTA